MPRLINQTDYSTILWSTLRPKVMMHPRDAQVYCPSREWFEAEFIPTLDQVTLPYEPESNDCEDISMEANVLMNRTVRDYVVNNNLTRAGNSLSAVCEVIIPAGYELNGIRDGVHAPHVIVFDDLSCWFFEAQPSTRRLTDADEAIRNRVVVRELKP